MFFQLQIKSKEKKVLKKFLIFFYKLHKNSSIWNVQSKLNKSNVVTVLKSPHVNKTAQEQFEYRTYNKQFIIYSFKPAVFLLTIKKIKELSFPGITIKLNLFSLEYSKFSSALHLFDPNNIKFLVGCNKTNVVTNFVNYVNLFDCYGELFLKKN